MIIKTIRKYKHISPTNYESNDQHYHSVSNVMEEGIRMYMYEEYRYNGKLMREMSKYSKKCKKNLLLFLFRVLLSFLLYIYIVHPESF